MRPHSGLPSRCFATECVKSDQVMLPTGSVRLLADPAGSTHIGTVDAPDASDGLIATPLTRRLTTIPRTVCDDFRSWRPGEGCRGVVASSPATFWGRW